jgi:hypothetical protein
VLDCNLTQFDLLRLLAPDAKSYLEVGVQEGRSLEIVLSCSQLTTLTLCDTWGVESGGSGRGSHDHIVNLPSNCVVTFLDKDSRLALPELQDVQFDLVHVDGGHTYNVVTSDLRECWRLCRSVMVVHDISFVDVWKAFFEFIQTLNAVSVECYFGGHGTAVLRRLT